MGVEVELYGDLDRGVVDYVLVRKGSGCIMVTSSHSRVAMGVDPPVQDPRMIVVLYGLRRPPTQFIKFDRIELERRLVIDDPWFGVVVHQVVREGDMYVVWDGGERLWVYDVFDAKYDKHMLLQIIGRWYMQSVEVIVHNAKYSIVDIKYYAIDVDSIYGVPRSEYYVEDVRIEEVRFGNEVRKVKRVLLEPVRSFDEAVGKVVKYERCDSGTKLRRLDYLSLRNVYNSLRFVKRHLMYRSLSREEEWWFAKKIVRMINGFEYAMERGLEIPSGLRRFFEAYRDEGIGALLDRLKEWLGIDEGCWRRIVKKLVLAFGVRSVYLEYKYRLKKVPRGVVIEGVNDSRSRSIDSYIPAVNNRVKGGV